MNRLTLTAAIIALAAAPLAGAQTSNWTADPAHSDVSFSISHMGISTVRGHFSVTASIAYNDADITKSTVNATIDVSSVNTGQQGRDADISGAGWFDTAHFKTATFTSTSITKSGSQLTINGNLTLHGVTKPVVLQAEGPTGPVNGMDHKPHAGFTATTTIKRTDFGVGSNFPPAMVGDDVKLEIDLEIVKQS
jgi:polyisoprenoid-binding protein YceI